MTTPKLSVLMPVRNGGAYLADAIQSVLRQHYASFEFIIIDDGSEDTTPQILQHFANCDRRIRIVTRPPQGMRAALNHGLSLASAETIARMDADDIALPTRFTDQLQAMQAQPDLVALGGQAWAIDSSGLRMFPLLYPLDPRSIERTLLSGTNCLNHPTMMYRREAVLHVGGYQDEYPTDDYGLWLRLCEIGLIANLPAFVLEYRLHATSSTLTKHQQQRFASEAILASAYQRRGLGTPPPLPDDNSPRSTPRIHHHWAMSAVQKGVWAAGRKHAWLAWRAEPRNLHALWTYVKSVAHLRRVLPRRG